MLTSVNFIMRGHKSIHSLFQFFTSQTIINIRQLERTYAKNENIISLQNWNFSRESDFYTTIQFYIVFYIHEDNVIWKIHMIQLVCIYEWISQEYQFKFVKKFHSWYQIELNLAEWPAEIWASTNGGHFSIWPLWKLYKHTDIPVYMLILCFVKLIINKFMRVNIIETGYVT